MKHITPVQFENSSLNPAPSPGNHQNVGWVLKIFQRLFILVSIASFFTFVIWFVGGQKSTVVSSQSIGRFVSMTGPGGLQNTVVIETDQGSYPISDAPAITKGTPLVLEARLSGQRYICDVTRDLCIKTTASEFKRARPAPTSPTSALPVSETGS